MLPKSPFTSKLRFTQRRRLIARLLLASLVSVIPTLVLLGKLMNPTAEDHHIRAIETIDHHKRAHHKRDLKPLVETQTSVVCGSHKAPSCNECPRGNGAGWCNGECEWRDEDEECVRSSKLDHLQQSSTKELKSFPGFTKERSVVCGGHKAPSCDQCPQGNGASWCNNECEWRGEDEECVRRSSNHLHPDYFRIIDSYAFQPVMNNNNEYVNVIMVRSPFRGKDDEQIYKFYKDDILFLGISSFEAFPLKSPNPYSGVFESEYYLNMFPGFLHMMRDPDEYFPPEVKTILMSQSDFNLDAAETFGKEHANDEKIYDFVYSGGDQDVASDCVGWASYNKNFSFVREALEVMCSSEFNVTGVLVANKNKANTKACTIPAACEGKMVQTTFLDQDEFFGYLSKARWAFLPQVCDASPRVSTQAMSMNVPMLMNRNIMGGWKYMNPGETGEFFHDISDFKDHLRRILDNTRGKKSPYEPLKYVKDNLGSVKSGERLLSYVLKHWGNRITFPQGTIGLVPTGA